MTEFTIRSLTPQDLAAVADLQQAYARAFPAAKVNPAAMYLSPAFHNGQDVFCAFSAGQLVAYAPLYAQINTGPAHLPHRVWVETKAHPAVSDPTAVKDRLLDCIQQRAHELVDQANQAQGPRPAQVIFEYMTQETAAIDYVTSRGFVFTTSVFTMGRDLAQTPLPPSHSLPEGFDLKYWKMESEAEQQSYVDARNRCFPESPITLEEWQYFMKSPMWAVGTLVAAFDPEGRLAGCVSAYWNEEENQHSGVEAGYTEDIFVGADYRGRGIASAMITSGLKYLKDHNLSQARLMVLALNENALGLYRRLGFEVGGESRFYARAL